MTNGELPLHDIKPPVEIHDYTVLFFTVAALVVAAVALAVAFVAWRHWRQRRSENRRRRCFERLQHIKTDDAKAAAYAITRYGRCFAGDSERLREAYRNLTERLAPYKYRKTVPPLDEETLSYYRIFLGMIDV